MDWRDNINYLQYPSLKNFFETGQAGENVSLEQYMSELCHALDGTPLSPGDEYSRIVSDVSNIQCHDISGSAVPVLEAAGLARIPIPAYCVHVSGDVEYWANRLRQDYDMETSSMSVIDIKAIPGDFIVDDFQYSHDPDDRGRADSSILVTSRAALALNRDFVVDEQMTSELRSAEYEDDYNEMEDENDYYDNGEDNEEDDEEEDI